MNAKEARLKSQKFNNNQHSNQYNEITTLISEALGEFEIRYYGPILESVKAKLIADGFKVEPAISRPNETEWDIKW